MQRVLSTYLFVNRKLTAALVGEAARAEVSALNCSARAGISITARPTMRANWPRGLREIISRCIRSIRRRRAISILSRESGTPLSISDPERLRRQEAVDEIKRALDLVEYIPFRYCIQHVARSRDIPDQRLWDAAFSSLEHFVPVCRTSRRHHGARKYAWRNGDPGKPETFSGADALSQRQAVLRCRARAHRGRRSCRP